MKFLTKKVKVTLLVVLLLVVGFASVRLVSAWLTDTNAPGTNVQLVVGKVDYTMNVTATTQNPVVPGQVLVDGMTIANDSTVTSNFRMQITATAVNGTTTLIPATAFGALTGGVASVGVLQLALGGTDWVYDGGYYYYGGTTGIVAAEADLTVGDFSITLTGAAGNAYATGTITLTFLFQAKQAEHVEWGSITTFEVYG